MTDFEFVKTLGALHALGCQIAWEADEGAVETSKIVKFTKAYELVKSANQYQDFVSQVDQFCETVVGCVQYKCNMFEENEEIVYDLDDCINSVIRDMSPLEWDGNYAKHEDLHRYYLFVALQGFYYYGVRLEDELNSRVIDDELRNEYFGGLRDYGGYVQNCNYAEHRKHLMYQILFELVDGYYKGESSDEAETDLREYVLHDAFELICYDLADEWVKEN